MSTKTGREDRTTGWILALTLLFTTVIDLVQRKKRTAFAIETLIRALQYFKENRLIGVVGREANDPAGLPTNFQELLSLKIVDISIDERTRKFLLAEGFRYVGELYRFVGAERNRDKKSRFNSIAELLISLDLPTKLDPIAAGWRPPYWQDSLVLAALTEPLIDHAASHYLGDVRHGHTTGLHYFGQVFANLRRYWDDSWRYRTRFYDLSGLPLHAAMHLPPNWTPPTEPPASWLAHIKEQEPLSRQQSMQTLAAGTGERAKLISVDVLKTEVGLLDLSVRSRHCLNMAKIIYLGTLVQKQERELLKVPNFGRKSVREIREVLTNYGLVLDMDPTHDPVLAEFNAWLVAQPR